LCLGLFFFGGGRIAQGLLRLARDLSTGSG